MEITKTLLGNEKMNHMQKMQYRITCESTLVEFQLELSRLKRLHWGELVDAPEIKQIKANIVAVESELAELNN